MKTPPHLHQTAGQSGAPARQPVPSPTLKTPACFQPAIAVVLLAFAAMWPWRAAAQWLPVTNGIPTARSYAAMAEDPSRARILLFGGTPDDSKGLDDTWEWNSTNASWQAMAPLTSPPARFIHAMAYWSNGTNSHDVVFGGWDDAHSYLGDTWTWDGANWHEAATNGPSARYLLAMASQPTRQSVLLFGGYGGNLLGDTWQWNGSAWTQLSVSGPAPRAGHAMAYDAGRDRVVLFGGQASTGYLGDTWEWDGASWTLASTNGPPARRDFGMAYNGSHIVVFGGTSPATPLGDTWEWDGTNWMQTVDGCPAPRYGFTMAGDSTSGRPLLQGGELSEAGTVLSSETWSYYGPLITIGPAPVTTLAGQPASFSVVANTNGGNPTYQWQLNTGVSFQAIPGATNPVYFIPSVTTNDSGLYQCVVQLSGCSATSSSVPLSLSVQYTGNAATAQGAFGFCFPDGFPNNLPVGPVESYLASLGAVFSSATVYGNSCSVPGCLSASTVGLTVPAAYGGTVPFSLTVETGGNLCGFIDYPPGAAPPIYYYDLCASAVLTTPSGDQYNFQGLTGFETCIGHGRLGILPPAMMLPADFCECPAVVNICFVDCTTGAPIDVSGTVYGYVPGGYSCSVPWQASGATAGTCKQLLVRGNVSGYHLHIEAHSGTDPYTTQITFAPVDLYVDTFCDQETVTNVPLCTCEATHGHIGPPDAQYRAKMTPHHGGGGNSQPCEGCTNGTIVGEVSLGTCLYNFVGCPTPASYYDNLGNRVSLTWMRAMNGPFNNFRYAKVPTIPTGNLWQRRSLHTAKPRWVVGDSSADTVRRVGRNVLWFGKQL